MNEELNQDVDVTEESGEQTEPQTSTVENTPDASEADEPQDKGYITEDRLTELLKEERKKAVDEALKRSKMSEEERLKHDDEEKERQLQEREAAITLKELRLETENLLTQQNLNKSLIGFVMGKDLEDTKCRVKLFKETFDKAVQEQVEKRLVGRVPKESNSAVKNSIETMRQQIRDGLGSVL